MSKKTITHINTYDGTWGTLSRHLVDINGQKVVREVYDSRGDGAAALLYNKDRDAIVLIRQWRITAQLKGIDDGYILEVPAGLLDNEAPIIAMQRELIEETGYQCNNLTMVTTVFASPGAHLEQIHLYKGIVADSDRISQGGSIASEQEEIEIVHVPAKEVTAMIADGRIIDAKTIILLQDFLLNEKIGH